MQVRPLDTVGSEIARRRIALGISENRMMELASIDRKTLKALESGTRWPHEDTRLRVEKSLQWKPGSIQSIRDGGTPTPADSTDDPPDLTDMSDDELLSELCRRLAMRHNKPEYPVPIGFIRSPYAARQGSGVGGDEEGDKRRQLGG